MRHDFKSPQLTTCHLWGKGRIYNTNIQAYVAFTTCNNSSQLPESVRWKFKTMLDQFPATFTSTTSIPIAIVAPLENFLFLLKSATPSTSVAIWSLVCQWEMQ